MSTHAIVVFIDNEYNEKYTKEKPYAKAYVHYDGYPKYFGKQLKNFLDNITIRSSIRPGDEIYKSAVGMGCLVAQFFSKFKTDIGNIYYLHPDEDNCHVSYIYYVTINENSNINITVKNSRNNEISLENQ
jgi:hypothetical protein